MKTKRIFHAKVKKINLQVGDVLSVILNEEDAWNFWISAVDRIWLMYKNKEIILHVDLSNTLVEQWEIGVTRDVYEKYGIENWEVIGIFYSKRHPLSVKAVQKKLLGKKLSEEEITALVHDMADNKISDTLVTYYAASSFFYKSRKKEMFYTAKASAEYGNTIKFDGIAAVKYCIWWVPWNETTMILAPIIASLGIKSPKTFSKAITSPAATGECVETLMDINFAPEEMKKIVEKTNCCLSWWKNMWFAPANDRIIKISYPLSMEAHSKMVISIAAKIYAGGTTHCLIDIPVWPTAKIKNKKTAKIIKSQFEYIAKHLWMKIKVVLTDWTQPIGRWVWAVLQVREVLRILQQDENRSLDLEKKAIFLATELLKLTWKYKWKKAEKIVREQLVSGKAWEKMKEIIEVQNWDNTVTKDSLKLAKHKKEIKSLVAGNVKNILLRRLTELARILWCPLEKKSGLYLDKKVWDLVKKWDTVFTLHVEDKEKIVLAEKFLEDNVVFEIV